MKFSWALHGPPGETPADFAALAEGESLKVAVGEYIESVRSGEWFDEELDDNAAADMLAHIDAELAKLKK